MTPSNKEKHHLNDINHIVKEKKGPGGKILTYFLKGTSKTGQSTANTKELI